MNFSHNNREYLGYDLNDSDALEYLLGQGLSREELDAVELSATQATFRETRNTLLKELDIEINIAVDAGLDVTEFRAYRQALRDAPQTWVMPEPIVDTV